MPPTLIYFSVIRGLGFNVLLGRSLLVQDLQKRKATICELRFDMRGLRTYGVVSSMIPEIGLNIRMKIPTSLNDPSRLKLFLSPA